jgi:hypothetical protein
MSDMEILRDRVSQADASLEHVNIRDMDEVSRDAIFDLIRVLTAAKAVVLES